MCQTFCDLIVVMWFADAVSKVKYENLVERCVRRSEEKGAAWDTEECKRVVLARESVGQMASWTQLRQGNVFSERRILLQVERSGCVTEKLSMCCCNEDGQTKSHVKNVVMSCVQRSEERH